MWSAPTANSSSRPSAFCPEAIDTIGTLCALKAGDQPIKINAATESVAAHNLPQIRDAIRCLLVILGSASKRVRPLQVPICRSCVRGAIQVAGGGQQEKGVPPVCAHSPHCQSYSPKPCPSSAGVPAGILRPQ